MCGIVGGMLARGRLDDGRLDRAAGLYWDACETAPRYASALLAALFALHDEGVAAQAATYLACAPRSNAAYKALDKKNRGR